MVPYWPYAPAKRVRLANSVLNYWLFSPSLSPSPRSTSLQGQKGERDGEAGTRKLEAWLHKLPLHITLYKILRHLPIHFWDFHLMISHREITSVLWHPQSYKGRCSQNASLIPVVLWCLHRSEAPGTGHVSPIQLKCTQLSEALNFCFVFGAQLHQSEEFGIIFFGRQTLALQMFPSL